MDDDTKLKIILYIMLILAVIVIIGTWEMLIEPIITFIETAIEIN